MALTSPTNLPSPDANTPGPVVPYRLDTAAVLVVRRPITPEERAAIRIRIQPRSGWWQFELRPWHYTVALASVFGCVTAVVLVVLTHSAVR